MKLMTKKILKKSSDLRADSGAKIKSFHSFAVLFLGFSATNLQYCGYAGIERNPSSHYYVSV